MSTNTAPEWTVTVLSSRPTIHKLNWSPIHPTDIHMFGWRWVKTQDLLNGLCGIVIRPQDKPAVLMPSVSMLSELYDSYALLSEMFLTLDSPKDPREAKLTWVGPYGYACGKSGWPSDEHRHTTYVPSGFSNTVLDLAEKGIVKVRAKDTTGGRHVRIGIAHDGTEKEIWFNNNMG